MKKPTIAHEGLVSLDAIRRMRPRCAWKDCTESFAPGATPWLPPGWRWLALWAGPIGVPPWAAGNKQDRDAVLCPRHARMLHEEVLTPLSVPMGETKGNA